jgi:DNA-binding MarR family transcriptional regulator
MEWKIDADGESECEPEFEPELEFGRRANEWPPIGAPQQHVSYWVRLAGTRFSENLAKMLEEWRLLPSEWAVLRELYGPGRRSPVELAKVIGMSKGGMSKLIDRLVKKELVRKDVSKFDRRVRAVGLTAYGKDWVESIASLEKDLDREFFGKLRGGGRYRLTEYLKRILTARQRKHMEEWVFLQSDYYCESSEREAFWDELCSHVAAAATLRSGG